MRRWKTATLTIRISVIFEKVETGHITALRSNVAEVNRMQGQITDEILHRLSEVATSELEIPLGTLTGSALLAGRGPSLFVRMQAVGSASAAFRTSSPPQASTRPGTRSFWTWMCI